MKWPGGSNVRTAVVAAGVAAVTAVVMAGVPALAGSAASSAPTPPVIIAGAKSGVVIITGASTVARLSLPAGSWSVYAKADVSTQGGGPVELHCTLQAGSSTDLTLPQLESGGTSAFTENISLSVAHRFLSPGRAVLSCNSFGVTVDVSSIKITAIKAGTLTLVKL